METDPHWGKELDSDGESIIIPDCYITHQREYEWVDIGFVESGNGDEWLDSIVFFSCMLLEMLIQTRVHPWLKMMKQDL